MRCQYLDGGENLFLRTTQKVKIVANSERRSWVSREGVPRKSGRPPASSRELLAARVRNSDSSRAKVTRAVELELRDETALNLGPGGVGPLPLAEAELVGDDRGRVAEGREDEREATRSWRRRGRRAP